MPRKGWPYRYPSGRKVPTKTRAKYKRCVKKVKGKNKKVKSPHAVCRASILKKTKRKS